MRASRLRLPALGLWLWIGVALVGACRDHPTGPPPPLKIYTTQAGLHRIDAAQLRKAGWSRAALTSPASLALFNQGHLQPIWIQGRDDTLTLSFYATQTRSPYTAENVYWLQNDPVQRSLQPRATGDVDLPPTLATYTATLRLEENTLYAPQAEDGDRWFWARIVGSRSAHFSANLSAVDRAAGHLRLAVWASTESPVDPDHRLQITVNQQSVADVSWDGRGRVTIDAPLPAGLLTDGANQIMVTAPPIADVAANITYVDWIELSYVRRFVAETDSLPFVGEGGTVSLVGFSGAVHVWDVTDPAEIVLLTPAQRPDGWLLQTQAGRQYVAAGPRAYLSPARIAAATPGPELATHPGAEYVAIGPVDLLAPLEPLLELRRTQGLSVMAVTAELIYDQFAAGLVGPAAIQDFLRHAAAHWRTPPRYVLLVGDASYDPLGHVAAPEANRLPTFLISTVYGGETASDVLFAQLDDDLQPDIALGRLPARNADQLSGWVEKIRRYEEAPPVGAWRRHVLAIADGEEAQFAAAARHALEELPAAYSSSLVAPPAGTAQAHREVQEALDQGSLLVAYFGHGSVTQWGKEKLFSVAEVAALGNGSRLPIFLQMTCLTGLFTHPDVLSLAESLLWQPDRGAVAVLAPTSLTLAFDQSFLSQPLISALVQPSPVTLGDALLQAQRQVPVHSAGARDVLQTFLLFGDPATRLVEEP